MTAALLILLALLAAVAAGAWYAGWRSAASYLNAARAVSEVSNAAIGQANEFRAALDRMHDSLASLESATKEGQQRIEQRQAAVEDSLVTLFQGFERAGLVRSSRGLGRQVGEAEPGA